MVMIAQQPMGAPGVVVSHSSMQVGGAAYPAAYAPVAYGPAMRPEQTLASHDKAPLVV